MTESQSKDAIVIGAGIVGICAALSLREKGFDVTVLDRVGPAEATSHGNAGVVSPWSCVPQSMPGLWKSVPKWLLDPEGPLNVRWAYLPRMLPWLGKFLGSGAEARLPAIADAMLAVNRPSLDMYHQHLAGTGEEGLVKDCYYLHVSRTLEGANPNSLAWRLRRERAVPFEAISGDEVREIEPELSPDIKAAVMVRQQGRTVNPGRLGKVLAAKAESLGVTFPLAEVTAIVPTEGGGYRVEAKGESYTAGTVVLAAGVWSARLLEPLGVKVSLEAERGYHLIFKDPGITLTNSIMDADNKFVTSSMETGVRSAGTAEFAGIDAAPNYQRAKVFAKHTKSLLPNLNTEPTEEWMGRRPSPPDSVPYIGEVPGYPRLYHGFGHGHLGLTGAPMTGRMVAALASGEPLNVDMTPYRIDRFGG
jgi:D-amino-acid dehydrogenase